MTLRGLNIKLFRALKLIYIKIFCSNISIGKKTIIDFNVGLIVKAGSKVSIGNNVYLRGISRGYQAGMTFPTTLLLDVSGAEVNIGDNVRINGAYIHAQKRISIGDCCVIASNVNIMDSNGHEVYSSDRTRNRDIADDIEIGRNVWIGVNVVILKGTYIGENSIVAANSVVKGSFPTNSLISGNPASVVKILRIEHSNP